MSLQAHSFQPSPLNEDTYRLWLNFKTSLNGSLKLHPLELHLLLSPPCHGAAKICSPMGRSYSIWTVSNDPLERHSPLHRCSGTHVSPYWRRRLEAGRDLPRRAKNVHDSPSTPSGGIVTYVTEEEIVVRYYT